MPKRCSGHHAAAGPATHWRGDENQPGATGAETVTQLTGATLQARRRAGPLRTVPWTLMVIIKLALGIALIVLGAVQWRRRNRARRSPAWLTAAAGPACGPVHPMVAAQAEWPCFSRKRWWYSSAR